MRIIYSQTFTTNTTDSTSGFGFQGQSFYFGQQFFRSPPPAPPKPLCRQTSQAAMAIIR